VRVAAARDRRGTTDREHAMSTFHAFLDPKTHRDTTAAPMLFLFLIPMLAVVGLIVWLASGPTWGFVAAALVAIVLFTGTTRTTAKHRAADRGSARGRRHRRCETERTRGSVGVARPDAANSRGGTLHRFASASPGHLANHSDVSIQ
jgi:hypothetical protein